MGVAAALGRDGDNVGTEIKFYLVTLILLLASIEAFYDAWRIQHDAGVISQSRVSSGVYFIVGIFQLIVNASTDNALFNLIVGSFAIVILAGFFLKHYLTGRKIAIYRTSHASVFDQIREVLDRLSIPYLEKETLNSDEYLFELIDSKATIKVRWWWGISKETCMISLKKWRRIPQWEVVEAELLDTFRKGRDNIIFWWQIISHCALGIVGLMFIYYLWSLVRQTGINVPFI